MRRPCWPEGPCAQQPEPEGNTCDFHVIRELRSSSSHRVSKCPESAAQVLAAELLHLSIFAALLTSEVPVCCVRAVHSAFELPT